MKNGLTVKRCILDLLIIILCITGAVFLVYAFKGLYPFGNGTIAYSDMSQQTIPFYYYIYDILHGSELPDFTWKVGTGSNMMGVMSQFSFLSPLNLIFYLTDRDGILMFANIVFVVKAVCVALAMYVYTCCYKVKSHIRIVASILYALGAGTIIYYVLGYNMDIAVLLPLVMAGVHRMMKDGKSALFIISSTLCLIVNVYFAAMVYLYLVISGVLQIILLTDKGKRDICSRKLLSGIFVSIMCAAFVWLPSFICISNSSRFGGIGINNIFDIYSNALGATWSDEYMKTMMLVNMAFFFAVYITAPFVSKKFSGRYFTPVIRYGCILCGLMLLSVIIPTTELLWHGGTRVEWPVRFIFVVTFAFSDFFLRLSEQLESSQESEGEECAISTTGYAVRSIFAAVAVVVTAVASYYVYRQHIIEIYNGINNVWRNTLIVFGLCLLVYSVCCIFLKYGKYVIAFVMAFELMFGSVVWIGPLFNETNSSVEYIKKADALLASLETEPLSRIKDYNCMLNSNYAFCTDVNSVANFIHTVDGDFQPYMKSIGYPVAWTRILENGGTPLTDSMLGMKYILSDYNPCESIYREVTDLSGETLQSLEENNCKIYENTCVLPSVYKVNGNPLEETDNTFIFQNQVFTDITGVSDELFRIIERNDNAEGIEYETDIIGDALIYLYSISELPMGISVNGIDIDIPNMNDRHNRVYPALFNNGVVLLGEYKDEHVNISINNYEGNPDDIRLAYMDVDVFVNGMKGVEPASESITFGKASVEFDYACDESSILVLPIYNSDGWNCSINTNDSEIVRMYGGLIGVRTVPGDNRISIGFFANGRLIGSILSIVGLILACILLIFERKKNSSLGSLAVIGRICYFMIIGIGVLLALLLYLIPLVAWIFF